MKVKCVRFLDGMTGQEKDYSSFLTIGQTYHVLEMYSVLHGRTKVRVLGKEVDTPAIFDLRQFEVVSPKIPPGWALVPYDDGSFVLGPEPWMRPGFWEKYFDKEDAAMGVFEDEQRKIVDFEP